MAKTIKFPYDGKDYTLEFNRRSIERMEQNGCDSKPLTTITRLFEGAFLMHHPYCKKETIDEIFKEFTNKKELLKALTQMYAEPLEALVEDSTSKNAIAWDKSF